MSAVNTRVIPSSIAGAWRKVFASNFAGNFVTPVATYAAASSGGRPTVSAGQSLIDFGSRMVPAKVQMILFGAGADDNTVKIRVWGFRTDGAGGYIGSILWAGTGTLGTLTGAAGFAIKDTDLIADVITTTIGTEGDDCRTLSPSGNLVARVRFLTAGSEFLIVEGDKDAATSANALIGEE